MSSLTVKENGMRALTLLLAMIAFLVANSVNAKPQENRPVRQAMPDHVAACDGLRGSKKGLHGLCVAFCAQRDQSNVDMNDISSVRAAAPSLHLLQKYNERKTESDPDMPCMADDGTEDDDQSDAGTGGGNDSPPTDLSCGCWSTEELQAIDGTLAVVRDMTPDAKCTANANDNGTYEAQVFHGYNVDSSNPVVVSSAFAYVSPDGGEAAQGCMFQSPTTGIRNFPLEQRAEAEHCIQMILDQCAAIGR